MTECERIIKESILPESFFEEEIICDFKVDITLKKIWAVSLDLLFKFDKVCRDHNLHYSLAYGSLLGAIRHHGFIPWDDDIDVFMTREDYDRLLLLKHEFTNPYYLQIPGENGYLYSFVKLRNSNTTALSQAFRYESFNQGIALDIFVLDNYNPETLCVDLEMVKLLISECSTLMRRSNPHPNEKDIELFNKFPTIRNGVKVIGEMDSILRKNQSYSTDKYVCLCNLFYEIKRGIFFKKDIDCIQDIKFYGHSVMIPENYDIILKIIYGDYMMLPPIEERGKWHLGALFDPDRPYTDYIKGMWDKEKNR